MNIWPARIVVPLDLLTGERSDLDRRWNRIYEYAEMMKREQRVPYKDTFFDLLTRGLEMANKENER
jgi:hypothetical protein